jgi:hypothetical protein
MDTASSESRGSVLRFRPAPTPRAGVAQLGAGEHQHVHRQVPHPVDQVVQEVQQAGVGVLRVLDQQDHRVLGRQPLEEQPPAGEQLLPGQGFTAVPGERHAEQPALAGAPQSPQKRSPSSSGAPHRPHPTRLLPRSAH